MLSDSHPVYPSQRARAVLPCPYPLRRGGRPTPWSRCTCACSTSSATGARRNSTCAASTSVACRATTATASRRCWTRSRGRCGAGREGASTARAAHRPTSSCTRARRTWRSSLTFAAGEATYRMVRKHSKGGGRRSAARMVDLQASTGDGFRSLTEGSVRETEDQVERLLHMSYETFVNSAFLLQGEADRFTTSKPAQRKETLAEILGLSLYERLQEQGARARARARRAAAAERPGAGARGAGHRRTPNSRAGARRGAADAGGPRPAAGRRPRRGGRIGSPRSRAREGAGGGGSAARVYCAARRRGRAAGIAGRAGPRPRRDV